MIRRFADDPTLYNHALQIWQVFSLPGELGKPAVVRR